MMMEVSVSILIRNQDNEAVDLMLEPWGEIYPVDPRSFVRFVMQRGAADISAAGVLEIEASSEGLTLWPPSGSLVRLLTPDGTPLGEDAGPRSPTP